jgi:hypothetical protein
MLEMTKDSGTECFLDVLTWRCPHQHHILSLCDLYHQHSKVLLDGVLAFEADDGTR